MFPQQTMDVDGLRRKIDHHVDGNGSPVVGYAVGKPEQLRHPLHKKHGINNLEHMMTYVDAVGRTLTWRPPPLVPDARLVRLAETLEEDQAQRDGDGTKLTKDEIKARAMAEFKLQQTERCNFQSWTGLVDRVELVKTLQRVVNNQGQRLLLEEIEYAVKMYESIEVSMQRENFSVAYRDCVDLIRRYPNFSLPYFKAGLTLILIAAPPGRESLAKQTTDSIIRTSERAFRQLSQMPKAMKNLASPGDDMDDALTHGSSCDESVASTILGRSQIEEEALRRYGNKVYVSPQIIEQASHFWRCAMQIEPRNRHLAGLIDLALRLAMNMVVPRTCKYRDTALYPRSLGDAVGLALLEK